MGSGTKTCGCHLQPIKVNFSKCASALKESQYSQSDFKVCKYPQRVQVLSKCASALKVRKYSQSESLMSQAQVTPKCASTAFLPNQSLTTVLLSAFQSSLRTPISIWCAALELASFPLAFAVWGLNPAFSALCFAEWYALLVFLCLKVVL